MTKPVQRRGWSSRICLRTANGALLALVVVLGQVVAATPSAEAQVGPTFNLLYSFKGGTDGEFPYAGLVRDAAGNLYGTTYYGGDHRCFGFGGCGTVFRVDATGKETVLHSFTGPSGDGEFPIAGLVRNGVGNLYGTTRFGGSFASGVVFKLDKTDKETVLYSFTWGNRRG